MRKTKRADEWVRIILFVVISIICAYKSFSLFDSHDGDAGMAMGVASLVFAGIGVAFFFNESTPSK